MLIVGSMGNLRLISGRVISVGMNAELNAGHGLLG